MDQRSIYLSFIKPVLDKFVASILLVVLLPLCLFMSFLLLVSDGRVLFVQTRIGKEGKPFDLIKFKTMNTLASNKKQRTTFLGNWLRRLSIDEIPQLVNVLRGEMSIVGPRPLLVEYVSYYNEQEKKRHTVKPGITGLAQVRGRNLSTWEKRMNDDYEYILSVSFWMDLRILVMTFIQLVKVNESDFEQQDQETFIEYAKKR